VSLLRFVDHTQFDTRMHTVGVLSTNDHLVVEATYLHKTQTKELPCLQRDSNPRLLTIERLLTYARDPTATLILSYKKFIAQSE